MKRLRVIIPLIVLLALIFNTMPVYADTPDPDSTPIVEQINVYRNMRETGDMLVLVYANIPYGTIPDTPVHQTFTWSLIDTDNVTELGSTIGYTYNVGTHQDDGYGYNLYSFYFTADNVTTLGIVWGTGYTVRLTGNPAVFDTSPVYNYVISSGAYSPLTVRADVQTELATRILVIAADLQTKWGLSTAYALVYEYEATTALSLYGEAFFRGAIFGVQALAPGIFSVVIRIIEVEDRDWDPEYSENVTGQWSGTWIETAQEGGKALFGTDYDLLSVIIILGMSAGLLIGNLMITGDHWNALVDIAVVGIVGARLAMYDLGFLILIAALCFFYLAAKIWWGLIR